MAKDDTNKRIVVAFRGTSTFSNRLTNFNVALSNFSTITGSQRKFKTNRGMTIAAKVARKLIAGFLLELLKENEDYTNIQGKKGYVLYLGMPTGLAYTIKLLYQPGSVTPTRFSICVFPIRLASLALSESLLDTSHPTT